MQNPLEPSLPHKPSSDGELLTSSGLAPAEPSAVLCLELHTCSWVLALPVEAPWCWETLGRIYPFI